MTLAVAQPSKSAECVKVVVRCRPFNEKETAGGYERVVEIDAKRGVIEIRSPKAMEEAPKAFTFDSVYDWNSAQRDLYDETFRPLVESVLEGFNGTIFAYGQTGTGKTFTMEGIRGDPEKQGVIPNSFEHIFSHIARSHDQQYLVRASYLEIYQEEIRDLLHKDQSKRLEMKERPDIGVYVKDLSSFVTKNVKEIEHVMNVGNQNRSVGATNMNEHSSRSHAVFMITVECSQLGPDGKSHIRVGKLNLVDLAGSERQSKTGATGDRFKEATKINLSLSALGNVISALVDGKSTHVPYRDSKLTRLLQDSLGGNARTVMVANIGPASYNWDETVTTLRYASRAKNIQNKPKINEDPKDTLLRQFQEEIARLKASLDAKKAGGSIPGVPSVGKRKKTRRSKGQTAENGDVGGEEQEEEDDEEANAEEFIRSQQARLEEEKQALMQNKHIIAEEKTKLLAQMDERATQLQAELNAQQQLAAKIKAMESKLLCGGKNIVDHTNEQERILEQKRQELAEQKKREREMLQSLESHEEGTVEIQQTYTSLQQEVEIKTKKLKKLFSKLQQVKSDLKDLHAEHSRERQELETAVSALDKELKLKYLIIDNFVPPDHRDAILARAIYDEDEDSWRLRPFEFKPLEERPVATPGQRRPLSEYQRMYNATHPESYRHRGENILSLSLIMPERTTKDYVEPTVAPKIQAAIDQAIAEETEPISIDVAAFEKQRAKPSPVQKILSSARSAERSAVSQNKPKPIVSSSSSKSKHLNSKGNHTAVGASGIPASAGAPVYPKARGLVPKNK